MWRDSDPAKRKQKRRALSASSEPAGDFMFQLTAEEYKILRFHFGIIEKGRHSKYLPYVFTEQGVAMLSSVLRTKRAVQVNI